MNERMKTNFENISKIYILFTAPHIIFTFARLYQNHWNRPFFYSHDYKEDKESFPLVFLDYWIDLCCSLATRTHTRCLQAIASQISLGWCLLRTRSTLPAWRFYCTSIGLASEPFIKTSRDTLWWVFEILSKYNGTTHESAINALNYIV